MARETPPCPKCGGPTHVLSWQARIGGKPTREDSGLSFCRPCRLGVSSTGLALQPTTLAPAPSTPAEPVAYAPPKRSLRPTGSYATPSSLPSKRAQGTNRKRRFLAPVREDGGFKTDKERAQEVLRLRREDPKIGLLQLAQRAGVSRSAAYRILQSPEKYV